MLIRETVEKDLPQLLVLLKELDQEAELSLDAAATIWQRMRRYPYYRILVAEMGDKIVGMFSLLICDNLGHGGTPFAVIDNVVVDPDRQRNGIGKELMRKAFEIARQYGCYKLMLSSNKKRIGAHTFYRKLGFDQQGISFAIGPDRMAGADNG